MGDEPEKVRGIVEDIAAARNSFGIVRTQCWK